MMKVFNLEETGYYPKYTPERLSWTQQRCRLQKKMKIIPFSTFNIKTNWKVYKGGYQFSIFRLCLCAPDFSLLFVYNFDYKVITNGIIIIISINIKFGFIPNAVGMFRWKLIFGHSHRSWGNQSINYIFTWE